VTEIDVHFKKISSFFLGLSARGWGLSKKECRQPRIVHFFGANVEASDWVVGCRSRKKDEE